MFEPVTITSATMATRWSTSRDVAMVSWPNEIEAWSKGIPAMLHAAQQMNGRLMTSSFRKSWVVLANFLTNNKFHLDRSSPSNRDGSEGKHHHFDCDSSDGRGPPLQHKAFMGPHSANEG